MSDECDKASVGLVKYIDDKFETLKHIVDLRFSENQRAIDKAERTMNARLEGMNEFRESLKEQGARFVTTDVLNAKSDGFAAIAAANQKRIEMLELSRAESHGKQLGINVVIGAIVIVVNLLILYLTRK